MPNIQAEPRLGTESPPPVVVGGGDRLNPPSSISCCLRSRWSLDGAARRPELFLDYELEARLAEEHTREEDLPRALSRPIRDLAMSRSRDLAWLSFQLGRTAGRGGGGWNHVKGAVLGKEETRKNSGSFGLEGGAGQIKPLFSLTGSDETYLR